MTNVTDYNEMMEEVVIGLRNADILTTTQRSVTTTTVTGSISGTVINIVVSNVKNVRSLSVAAVAKTLGTDYTLNLNNAGTCTITFGTTQTGTTSITYDYGSDKIFPGYPRNDLSITSFPQIAVEHLDTTSDTGGFGNVNESRHDYSIIAYAAAKEDVRSYIKSIRTWIIDNQTALYNMKLIKPTMTGPIGVSQNMKSRVFQQNQDFKSWLNYEKN